MCNFCVLIQKKVEKMQIKMLERKKGKQKDEKDLRVI